MRPRSFVSRIPCAAGIAALAAACASEAWQPRVEWIDAYSRGIALAVAVDPASTPERALVASGAGGEIFALTHERGARPPFSLGADERDPTWRTRGVVLDLAVAGEHLYAAAFRDGVRVFARAAPSASVAHWPAPEDEDVLSVAVTDLPSGADGARLVAAGTERRTKDGGGALVILRHDLTSGSLRELTRFEMGTAVYAVAIDARSPREGAASVVLAGTRGGEVAGEPAALQRLDLALDGSLVRTTFWSPADEGGARRRAIVRDIELDAHGPRAYVAAFWDGVWAFDLDPDRGDGLTPLVGDAWPIRVPRDATLPWGCDCPDAAAFAVCAAHSVAVVDLGGEMALLAGFGPPENDAHLVQYVSSLTWRDPWPGARPPSALHACARADARPPPSGLFAFRIDGNGAERMPRAFAESLGRRGRIPLVPFELDSHRRGAREATVFASATGFGMHAFELDARGDEWRLEYDGGWDGSPPARLPMPAFDDLCALDVLASDGGERRMLYAGVEGGVACFDLDARAPLALVSRAPDGAVLVDGFGGANARLVGSTQRGRPSAPGGLRVFDLSDPLAPRACGEIEKGGFGLALACARAGDRRIVYGVQEVARQDEPRLSWSVKAFDLGTESEPRDPDRGEIAPLACFETDPASARALDAVAVLEVAPDRHVVYALYGPRPAVEGETNEPRGDVGLLALVARFGGDRFQLSAAANAWTPAATGDRTSGHRGVRIAIDPERARLYAAFVGLLAMYDVSRPESPRRFAIRHDSGAYGLAPCPVEIAIGPSIGGHDFVYVGYLNDGLAVLDATDARSFASGPLAPLAMPWQTTSVLVDPRDATRRRLFCAQGTAGLVHIELR